MPNFQLETPVVFVIFKRSDTTYQVFEIIRQVKPLKLFVIADGARPHVPDEAEKCAVTRAIIDRVDWDCEVFKNYSEINLGCKKRVSSGLDWVFENVEEAIILEDDCLPDLTFFPFCQELLERYRYDRRIMTISGNNFQFGQKRTHDSYYFSRYPHIWGWATWKRAWKLYDLEMNSWQQVQEQNILETILREPDALEYWSKIFQSVYNQEINTVWAYQWTFTSWIQNSLSIVPQVNLVSNIGFGSDGTNTTGKQTNFTRKFANMPTEAINFPLQHPKLMVRHMEADNFTQKELFMLGLVRRVKLRLQNLLKITRFRNS